MTSPVPDLDTIRERAEKATEGPDVPDLIAYCAEDCEDPLCPARHPEPSS